MKKTYITKLAALLIPAIALSVFSCGDPEMPTPVPATGAPTTSSNIRFLNASPDAPSLSFNVNNVTSATDVAYLELSPYGKIAVGQAAVRGVAASGTIGGTIGSGAILYRASATNQNNFSFNNNAFYTFIVMDSIARPKPTTLNGTNPGGPQFIALTDNNSAPAAGKAKVRLVNAAAGEGAVWITTASGVDFSTVNGTANAEGKTPGIAARAASAFVSIDPGTISLEFRTASNAGAVRVADDVTLEAGKVYTIVLSGQRIPANTEKGTPAFVKVPYEISVYQYN